MSCLSACRAGALTLATRGRKSAMKTARPISERWSPCDVNPYPPFTKQCFDINKVIVERGNLCHANMIRLFMYTHYWPREPTVQSLWMPQNSPYLDTLTDKYSKSGDRFLAFEEMDRTREARLIGVSAGYKVFPWMIDELEEWAHVTCDKPERTRMYFMAHCLKCANLMNKYNVQYVYDIEVLGTDAEIGGKGVGHVLLEATLSHAEDLGYAVAQLISVNHYASKICAKCGMKQEWSMMYDEYVDRTGHQVFFPRRPHLSVSVYSKHFEPSKPKKEPCKPPFI